MRTPTADEDTWGTNLNIHVVDFKINTNISVLDAVKLEIKYDIPAVNNNVTLKVKNIFPNGKIGVSLNNDPINPNLTSPYTISSIPIGTQVNLEAQEQNINGYDWIWNDVEAPIYPSKWVKYNSLGGQTFKSLTKNYSFQAALDDDNTTYEAGLRKICNITFKNNL